MSGQDWTADHIPDQSGRVAVVTGANSGNGLETARALAGRGALFTYELQRRVWAASEDVTAVTFPI